MKNKELEGKEKIKVTFKVHFIEIKRNISEIYQDLDVIDKMLLDCGIKPNPIQQEILKKMVKTNKKYKMFFPIRYRLNSYTPYFSSLLIKAIKKQTKKD
jgi:hypothetical protein